MSFGCHDFQCSVSEGRSQENSMYLQGLELSEHNEDSEFSQMQIDHAFSSSGVVATYFNF